jgi:hypothetical protein
LYICTVIEPADIAVNLILIWEQILVLTDAMCQDWVSERQIICYIYIIYFEYFCDLFLMVLWCISGLRSN